MRRRQVSLFAACAGAESGGWLVWHIAGRETFQVAGEERHHLMMVNDLQQIRPTDWLPGQRLDPIAVNVFLRPAETGQHQFKFRGVGCTARHSCLLEYVGITGQRQVLQRIPERGHRPLSRRVWHTGYQQRRVGA